MKHVRETVFDKKSWVLRIPPPKWLVRWLLKTAKRRDAVDPIGHIYGPDGSVYMERYVIIPFNVRWLFGIAMRIHVIRRSDMDPWPHDHPWWTISYLLHNGYQELVPREDPYLEDSGDMDDEHIEYDAMERLPGSIIFRGVKYKHKLMLDKKNEYEFKSGEKPVISLFITGPYRQGWGFFVHGKKVPWREYIKERDEHNRAKNS